MTDYELFNAVLDRLSEFHRLTIVRPYGDQVIEIKNHYGRSLGMMNPDGYNLLYNLTRVCKMLEDELR